jgi:hypothetical protein
LFSTAKEKGASMPREDELEEARLKALADRVMDAYGELDDCLGKPHFPVTKFNRFWQAVFDYSAAMSEHDWLHRDVAGVVNGLRDYLELQRHKAPTDIWWKIDQMEVLLFSNYNAYPEHGNPYNSENTS